MSDVPETVHIRFDSHTVSQAHARARAELPRVRDLYRGGAIPGGLYVKAPFPGETPDGRIIEEYLWFAVLEWRDDGTMTTRCVVDGVYVQFRFCDQVHLHEAAIYDWMIETPDMVVGGYTNDAAVAAAAEGATENEER